MKGIKLSIKDKNLYYAKLSYKYAKGREMAQSENHSDSLPGGNQQQLIQMSGQGGFRIPKGLVSKDKILVERNITGFSQIKLVKEEWKSRFVSKQLLKSYYNLSDKEYKDLWKTLFSKYGSDLIEQLESRLDVILFRLGFTKSLGESHNLIKHGLIHITNSKGYWKSRPVSYSKIYLEPGTLIGLNIDKLTATQRPCTHDTVVTSASISEEETGSEDSTQNKESGKPVSEYEIYNQILTNKIMHNMCHNTTSNARRVRHKKNVHAKRSLNGRYSWLSTLENSDSDFTHGLCTHQPQGEQIKEILSIGVLWSKPKFEEVLLPITLNTKKL